MAITINVNLDEILAALKNDLDFTGNADKYIKVNATADGFEFAAVTAPTWGAITGTLSSQTDLQTALDAKANLSGAAFTGDVSVTTSGSGDTLQLTNSGSGTTLNILNSGSGDFFAIDTNKLVVSNNGNLAVDTNTLFVDAVNNRVGILRTPTAYGLEIGAQALYFGNSYNGVSQVTPGALVYYNNSSLYFHTRTNSLPYGGGFKWIGALTANNPVQVAHMNQSGALYLGGTAAPSAQLHVNAQTTSTVGAIIQAAAGQTANLFEVKDSGGTVMASVSSAGDFAMNKLTTSSNIWMNASNTRIFQLSQTNGTLGIGAGPSSAPGAYIIFYAGSHASKAFFIESTGVFIPQASTATRAGFRWLDGIAPSSPVDGDMWRVGDVLYLRDGATTKSVTFT